MNTSLERLVRDALRDAAEAEQPPEPSRFADAALNTRRRRTVRRYSILSAAAVTAAAVIVVPLVVREPHDSSRPAVTRPPALPPPCATGGRPNGERCGLPVAMPGTAMTYLDAPGPLTLTSYVVTPRYPDITTTHVIKDSRAYVRDPATGKFAATPFSATAVSPDGRQMAAVTGVLPTQELKITDRSGHVQATVKLPATSADPLWSPDGTKILMTAWQGGFTAPDGGGGHRIGFIIIDAGSRRATLVQDPDKTGNSADNYQWAGSSSEIFSNETEPRFLDLQGRVLRRLPDRMDVHTEIGLPLSPDRQRLIATVTPPAGGIPAVVDARTGHRIRDLTFEGSISGWYDDRHLIAYVDPSRSANESLYITDLNGTRTRMLVWMPPGADEQVIVDMMFTPGGP